MNKTLSFLEKYNFNPNKHIVIPVHTPDGVEKVFLIDSEQKVSGLINLTKDLWEYGMKYDARGLLKSMSADFYDYLAPFNERFPSLMISSRNNKLGLVNFTYTESWHGVSSPLLLELLKPEYDTIQYLNNIVNENNNGTRRYPFVLTKNGYTYLFSKNSGHGRLISEQGYLVQEMTEESTRTEVIFKLKGDDQRIGYLYFSPYADSGGQILIPPIYDDIYSESDARLNDFRIVSLDGKKGLVNVCHYPFRNNVVLELAYKSIRFEIQEISQKDGERATDSYRTTQTIYIIADGRRGKLYLGKMIWDDEL